MHFIVQDICNQNAGLIAFLRLWVLVRTASLRQFKRVPTIYVLSKNKKNITIVHLKFIIFTAVKYCSIGILHGHVCVMNWGLRGSKLHELVNMINVKGATVIIT